MINKMNRALFVMVVFDYFEKRERVRMQILNKRFYKGLVDWWIPVVRIFGYIDA